MNRNLLIAVFSIILAVLVGLQVLLDYDEAMNLNKSAKEATTKPDYCIFIDVEAKTLYLLLDGKLIREYPVASGASGWPSPLGYWKIINKGDWGEGFGGRWMGLNVPWGTYGIHGTDRPESVGSAASHGCFRMFSNDVIELYRMVPSGTPVVVANGIFGPFGRRFDDINPGDRGSDVMAVQMRLKDLGYFKGYISGIYEDDLKHAVHSFQKKQGLKVKNTISRGDLLKMGFMEFE